MAHQSATAVLSTETALPTANLNDSPPDHPAVNIERPPTSVPNASEDADGGGMFTDSLLKRPRKMD
eukprot:CAMPEP_0174909876 /NCGR_PEP_ID=MMETSP0167-20121228/70494_1 /TAXON_ID=38298 /ORGANISM="Rhodella maculata, Strain CCMP736" /LENGTH=65 /DNA_ID=CAMNT_0016153991 /DNA_START=109 /DNA_END=304 /DNA_ORIENTATION=-